MGWLNFNTNYLHYKRVNNCAAYEIKNTLNYLLLEFEIKIRITTLSVEKRIMGVRMEMSGWKTGAWGE